MKTRVTCRNCGGVGYVEKKRPLYFGEMRNRRCRVCHGERTVAEDHPAVLRAQRLAKQLRERAAKEER